MQSISIRSPTFDLSFWKRLVVVNAAVPAVLLAFDAIRGQLGVNAVNAAIHITGILSLLFLILSLAVTPLRWLTGWNGFVAFRRSLGLFAFFYTCLHLLIYVAFDRAGNLNSAIDEILKRRYLQVGLTAFLLMLPLAATSTNRMISRLGGLQWKRLHRLAYAAAVLGALHYILLVKSDLRQPLVFAGVVAGLLSARVWKQFQPVHRRPLKRTSETPLSEGSSS